MLLFVSALVARADMKLARISDKDGYTNIRQGEGINFKVVATVVDNEVFYCEPSDAEWLKVLVVQWTAKDGQVAGFIHRSRVQYIASLPDAVQRSIIRGVFDKQALYANRFHRSDSTSYHAAVTLLQNHSDERYSPVLDIFPDYFCRTKDAALLNKLFATIWADSGSASEIPSFTLGDCFIWEPDLVLRQVKAIKNKQQRSLIIDDIDWGLHNHFDEDNRQQKAALKQFLKKLAAAG